jgi:hypothetical protein
MPRHIVGRNTLLIKLVKKQQQNANEQILALPTAPLQDLPFPASFLGRSNATGPGNLASILLAVYLQQLVLYWTLYTLCIEFNRVFSIGEGKMNNGLYLVPIALRRKLHVFASSWQRLQNDARALFPITPHALARV